jgi:hypothetical protein
MEDKLSLFGQFVGDWEIVECRFRRADGSWGTDRGEVHWNWILEGRALQDVWITIDEKIQKAVPDGTTVRFYDPKIDAWRITWISATQGAVKTLIGRQAGREIVLEGTTDDGQMMKWIFSDITPNSFRWHSEYSRDEGRSWSLREEMQIRRMRV